METLTCYTLRDQACYNNRKGIVLWAPQISSFESHTEDGLYFESSVSRRGAIPDPSGSKRSIFEVAANPQNEDQVRQSMIAVLREKMINDLYAANELLLRMASAGKIPSQELISAYEVSQRFTTIIPASAWPSPPTLKTGVGKVDTA